MVITKENMKKGKSNIGRVPVGSMDDHPNIYGYGTNSKHKPIFTKKKKKRKKRVKRRK